MRRTANAVSPGASARRASHLVPPLALLLALALTTCAGASVIVVDQAGGGDYLTVQEGVDAAVNEDTVQVMAGWYAEQVVVDGKCVTFEGSGPSGTAVFWDGAGPTLEFLNTPSPYRSYVRNINFGHSFDAGAGRGRQVHTVEWTGSTVIFDGAVINGGAIGLADVVSHIVHTGIESYQSTFDWMIVAGDEDCIIEETNVFELAEFSGWYEDFMTMGELTVTSSGSSFEELYLLMLCNFTGGGDTVGRFEVEGTFETSCTAEFTGCGIGDAVMWGDNAISFYDCVVDNVSHFWSSYPDFRLTMEYCLVNGFDMIADYGNCRLIHNTFDEWFYCQLDDDVPGSAIRSNVFTYYTSIIAEGVPGSEPRLPVTHNLFKHVETHVTALYDSLFTNLWYEDPRFCEWSPEHGIEDCSPCIGAAHDGGIIGAFGIGCDCTLVNAVEETSWGAIKALFR